MFIPLDENQWYILKKKRFNKIFKIEKGKKNIIKMRFNIFLIINKNKKDPDVC